MNRFSDFSTEQLIGEKISIDKILNKEIKVLAFRLKNSKIEKGSTYAQIQIELHGELRVIFTNSTVLKEQLQRYKEHLPFCTTIIKNNKYFFIQLRRIIMVGYPKSLKTKEDYEYVRNNFPKEMWKKDFQALLDSSYDWFFVEKLLKIEEIVLAKNQRIEYDEERDERYLYEYRFNPDCKLMQLGYMVQEVQLILWEAE